VKIWLKIAINAAKLPKFKAINRKSWSPRTIVVADLYLHSRLTWFCACAESYVVFNIRPYAIFRDNSIFLNRTAIHVAQWIGKLGSAISNMSRDTACAVSANAFSMVSMGNIVTHNSRTDTPLAVGSSNLVEGLNVWPSVYDHWRRSKGWRSRPQGHVTYQQQQNCNWATDSWWKFSTTKHVTHFLAP